MAKSSKAARRGGARKRKAAPTKAARKSARKPARRRASAKARKTTRKTARKTTGKTAKARPSAGARKAPARRARPAKAAAKRATAAPKPAAKAKAAAPPRRRAPTLDRERRRATEPEMVPTPPSSLDLDRSASAARSGRAELNQKLQQHTSSSPALTGGDVDADWEAAEAIGDEAPGGDNPTPDQDVVDDIGRALGVEYDDDEELRGGEEIQERDKKRWELDPASSDDFDERDE
jgi:hypothetical protein